MKKTLLTLLMLALAQIAMAANTPTIISSQDRANNLKAGDFNGKGKLDNADYQALREVLHRANGF